MNKFFVGIATVTLAASITACSSGHAAVAPVTKTTTVTVTASPSESSPVNASATLAKINEKGKAAYAKSANRAVIYQDYNIAKIIVARALEQGKFGTPYRYNSMKTKWLTGQVGWGGIDVNMDGVQVMSKAGLLALVYFNADGSINFSKGVQAISVDAGPQYKGVLIFDTMMPSGPTALPYDVSLDQSDTKRGKLWVSCIQDQGFDDDYCLNPNSSFRNTSDAQSLAELDMAGKDALDASMAKLFGADWRSIK